MHRTPYTEQLCEYVKRGSPCASFVPEAFVSISVIRHVTPPVPVSEQSEGEDLTFGH